MSVMTIQVSGMKFSRSCCREYARNASGQTGCGTTLLARPSLPLEAGADDCPDEPVRPGGFGGRVLSGQNDVEARAQQSERHCDLHVYIWLGFFVGYLEFF